MHTLLHLLTSYWGIPLVILVILATALFYRGRGGGFISFDHGEQAKLFGKDPITGQYYINFGGTTLSRFFWWVIPVTAETYLLAVYGFGVSSMPLWKLGAIFAGEFATLYLSLLLLSHGPFQSLGEEVTTKPTWVSDILPEYTMQDPIWKRVLIDFSGLTIVGFLRGLMQCIPLLFISLKFFLLTAGGAMMGIAYLIGYKIINNKIKLPSIANATEWGEFLTGAFYGFCLAAIAIMYESYPELFFL